MRLATAYFILIGILFIYGHFDKQRDHSNVRKEAKIESRTQTTSKRDMVRMAQAKQLEKLLSGTPLEESAMDFIDASYVYGLDFKILPSIAGTESTFGKFTPSCAPYNPFGYSSSTSPCGFYRFTSYHEAIWTVAQTLAHNRAYAGFRQAGEVSVLASEYNPGGLEHWNSSVNYFIAKIDEQN